MKVITTELNMLEALDAAFLAGRADVYKTSRAYPPEIPSVYGPQEKLKLVEIVAGGIRANSQAMDAIARFADELRL